MKIKTTIVGVVAATAVICSCSNNEELIPKELLQDTRIEITTDVNGTRACYTTTNLAGIGLCVSNIANPSYSYDNVKMTKGTDGWNSPTTLLWQNSTQAVEMLAYAPYADEGANPTVLANQSTEDGILASDFIAAYHPGFVPSATATKTNAEVTWNMGKVALNMQHMMSKICITVHLGNEYNANGVPATNPIATVCIEGSRLKGELTTITPETDMTYKAVTPTDTNNDASDITAYCTGYTPAANADAKGQAVYECRVVPQTIAANAFGISVTIGTDSYLWTSPTSITLKGGMQYSIEFNAGNHTVTTRAMGTAPWTHIKPY